MAFAVFMSALLLDSCFALPMRALKARSFPLLNALTASGFSSMTLLQSCNNSSSGSCHAAASSTISSGLRESPFTRALRTSSPVSRVIRRPSIRANSSTNRAASKPQS
uniref:Putative secreted protein n=1 Tax=Ixodes ricinus TaxID=34613 RepID=A0A6B0UGT4_IXORI